MIRPPGAKRLFPFGVLLPIITLLIYSNSFQGSFQYDDLHVIVKNPHLKSIFQVPQFFFHPEMGSGMFQETHAYRPLLISTFALNYFLNGLNVFGYHLFNCIVHSLSAIVIYLIVSFILHIPSGQTEVTQRSNLVAFFAALIFAVHPVQTESVTYITGRSSSLTALFFLTSFLVYMHYRLTGKMSHLSFSSVLFGFALLIKETAITFPVILALYDLFYLRRCSWRLRLFPLFPFLGLTASYLALYWWFFGSMQSSAEPIRPFYDHLLTQVPAWVHYLGTLLFPLNLSLIYDFPISHSLFESRFLGALLILVTMAVLMSYFSRASKPAGFFSLWFAVTLLPTNSAIALNDVVTERWLYLPSVGYAVIVALAVEWIFTRLIMNRGRETKIIFFFLCALLIEFYGYSTFLRNVTWANEWMLWEDTLLKSPKLPRPHNGLGLALSDAGQIDEAILEFRTAIAIDPGYGNPYLNLGKIYYLQGKFREAMEVNQKAMALTPTLAWGSHNNIGLIYLEQGRLEEAVSEFKKSIEARPLEPSPIYNLGIVYQKMGEMDLSIACMRKAINTDPDFLSAYKVLSDLYRTKGLEQKSQEIGELYRKHAPYAKTLSHQ